MNRPLFFLLAALYTIILPNIEVVNAQTNTKTGTGALFSNTTGTFNTATGYFALNRNTTGSHNTATGASALYYNTTGSRNTANGYYALLNNSKPTGKCILLVNLGRIKRAWVSSYAAADL